MEQTIVHFNSVKPVTNADKVKIRLQTLIESLNLGKEGRRKKADEPKLDVDEVMKNPSFQKALQIIPVMFVHSGRKGMNSYSLKHIIEETIQTYLSNAECILAFAWYNYPIRPVRGYDSYNFGINVKYIELLKNRDQWQRFCMVLKKLAQNYGNTQSTADLTYYETLDKV